MSETPGLSGTAPGFDTLTELASGEVCLVQVFVEGHHYNNWF